ncbi:MAG: hypothetical protein IH831_09260, partial [Planctomycetes bacterium]|nr:hypothetical protein [Planctomycetota bacterium]
GMHLYANMFQGGSSSSPKLDFEFLVKHGLVENPSALVSPLEQPELPSNFYSWPAEKAQAWALKNCSYVMLDFGDPKARGVPHRYNVVSVYEKFGPHKVGTAVAFEDGHVKWMSEAEARELIKKQTGKDIEQ